MRLASFVGPEGPSWGAVVDGRIADMSGHAPSLREALAAPLPAPPQPTLDLDDVALLAPLPDPPRVFCAGLNYASHRTETGRSPGDHPAIFLRLGSSVVGPGQTLHVPAISEQYDYEGELAVVVGRPGRAIPAAAAFDHVAGYACFNDGSVRDWQFHTSQFTAGKNFDRTGAIGPHLVTADEVPDPTALTLRTLLNGEVMQEATTDELIFDIPALVEYVSTFTELQPGDVIATGTPAGVGAWREPPVWLRAGDTIEVDITGVGRLSNRVELEVRPAGAG